MATGGPSLDLLEILSIPWNILRLKANAQDFGQSHGQAGMGELLSCPFDQRGLWMEATWKKSFAGSSNGCVSPHRAWLTGGRAQPSLPWFGWKGIWDVDPHHTHKPANASLILAGGELYDPQGLFVMSNVCIKRHSFQIGLSWQSVCGTLMCNAEFGLLFSRVRLFC